MSQDYKIIHYEAGDFKDQNGNTWCNVLFEGAASEQLRWVVKDPSAYKVGDTVYGHIEEKTSQAGKPYMRFYRDKKEDAPHEQSTSSNKPHTGTNQSTDESIARAVALRHATVYVSSWKEHSHFSDILDISDKFLAWLQGGGESTSLKANNNIKQNSDGTISPIDPSKPASYTTTPLTGYEKAKQVASRLKVDEDAEALSLYNSVAQNENEPFEEYPDDI